MRQLLKKGNIKAYENIRLSIKLAEKFVVNACRELSHVVTYFTQNKTTRFTVTKPALMNESAQVHKGTVSLVLSL